MSDKKPSSIDSVFAELEAELVNPTAPSELDAATMDVDEETGKDKLNQPVNDGSVIDADLPYEELDKLVEVPGMEGLDSSSPEYLTRVDGLIQEDSIIISRAMGVAAGLEDLANAIAARGVICRADIETAISIHKHIEEELPHLNSFTTHPTKSGLAVGLEAIQDNSKTLGALGAIAVVGLIIKLLTMAYQRIRSRAVMGKEDYARMMRTPKDFARMEKEFDSRCGEYLSSVKDMALFREAMADEMKIRFGIQGFTVNNVKNVDDAITDAFLKKELTTGYVSLYDVVINKPLTGSDVNRDKLVELIEDYPQYLEGLIGLHQKTLERFAKDYEFEGKLDVDVYSASATDSSLKLPNLMKSAGGGMVAANKWLADLNVKIESPTVDTAKAYMQNFIDPQGLKKVEQLDKAIANFIKQANYLKKKVEANTKMDVEFRTNRVEILNSMVVEITQLQKSIILLMNVRDRIIALGKTLRMVHDATLKVYYNSVMAARKANP